MINTEKASLTGLRQQLQAARTAKKAGYNVPDLLIGVLVGEINKKEGIVEVWECVKCQQEVKLAFRAKGISCPCGKIQLTWSA